MNSIIELENEIEIKECPYCKSNHFIKYGKFNVQDINVKS